MKIDEFYNIYRTYLLEFIPIYDRYTIGRRNKYTLHLYIDIILDVLKFGSKATSLR